jgi:predicted Fe-Mo cluster-binding NifX family protein
MKICIPVEENNGAQSLTYGHFGSAPWFIVYDTESGTIEEVSNNNEHHEHGRCNPLSSLQQYNLDAMITGGIGRRALEKIHAAGMKVYRADYPETVERVVQMFIDRKLPEVTFEDTCHHHH